MRVFFFRFYNSFSVYSLDLFRQDILCLRRYKPSNLNTQTTRIIVSTCICLFSKFQNVLSIGPCLVIVLRF